MCALPLALTLILTLPAMAVAETWRCEGENPGWSLWLDEARAGYSYPSLTEMEVVQQNAAKNREWPRALTLIGARDTAIVPVETLACSVAGAAALYRVLVLTQRGQSPILLSGCCEAPE